MRQMRIVNIVERGLLGIALPVLTRPPVPFDSPDKDLTLFTIRLYVCSMIAHIRTILAGIMVLDEAGNTPSVRLLCRHVFEWTAQVAYAAEKVSKHIKAAEWSDAVNIVSGFDRANSWIKKYGSQHGALPIQLDGPDPVRLKHWIAAYERLRVEEYGAKTVGESYGYLSEHAHPSGACFLEYREICGPEVRFVPACRAHLTDIGEPLIEWLMLTYRILGLAEEDTVRLALRRVIEDVAALQSQR